MRKKGWIKEPFCGFSHFVGICLSVIGLIVLLQQAQGRPWHLAGFAIYGMSLILMYTASTLYHSLHVSAKTEYRLMYFDHIAIYLLIAGTYTPVCLVSLRGAWGWTMLGAVYSMAAVGIVALLLFRLKVEIFRVILCVCMGWMALIAIGPLTKAFPPAALAWLFGGGIVYSIGTIIFAMDRPHLWPGKFSAHDLWHIFVLLGSACHFILMLRFVAPAG
ncbi:MAG: hemolysin III family protein [Armatimonadota bacterium]|nr:hemolysin III family protein [Armatimonadota bacterium]